MMFKAHKPKEYNPKYKVEALSIRSMLALLISMDR